MAKTVSYNFSVSALDTNISSTDQKTAYLELVASGISASYIDRYSFQMAASATANISLPVYVTGGNNVMEIIVAATYTDGSADQYVSFDDSTTAGDFNRILAFQTGNASISFTNNSDAVAYLEVVVRRI